MRPLCRKSSSAYFASSYGHRYAFVDFFYCPLPVRYFDAALQRRRWAVGCVIRNRIELYNATNRFLGLGPFRWVFHWMLVGAPFDGQRGHSRTFAAFTAMGAIGLLAHMLVIDPLAWSMMRIASGMCVAGCYTVVESWLQAKVVNENRGRVMGVYRVVDMGASMMAQLMIGVLAPASYVSYNLLALICCATLIPLTLTRVPQPETKSAPRLRPMLAIAKSPLATAGVIVAALTSAAFRMVGPVYGQRTGLLAEEIAYFLAAFVLGGALAQVPAGWLADKFDRRWVMIWLSAAAIVSCGLSATITSSDIVVIFGLAGLFGFTTFPIYSVAAAHAHDFADSDQRVELSAALMFWYATGAIAAPAFASLLIDLYGPAALFGMIAVGHLGLVVFGLLRMRARPYQTKKPLCLCTAHVLYNWSVVTRCAGSEELAFSLRENWSRSGATLNTRTRTWHAI